MRITETNLRNLIRQTLLEAAGSVGPMPGTPGKKVKEKSTLTALQRLIGADESGMYDDKTETAWDDFVDKHTSGINLIGATPDMIKTNWASAAPKIKSMKGKTVSFTPDIKGMYQFALALSPKEEQEPQAQASASFAPLSTTAAQRLYRSSLNDLDVWPEGSTLDDADKWYYTIDEEPGEWITTGEMVTKQDELRDAIEANSVVRIAGLTDDEYDAMLGTDKALYPITIPDVETLDAIYALTTRS